MMKRLLAFTAVLGLAALGTGVAGAQSPVLFNGNLNQVTLVDTPGYPPVGWTALGIQSVNNPGGGWLDCETSEPWCNGVNDPNPNGYGIFIKAFEGATNADPNLDNLASMYFYQDNPSSSNTTYTLSGYVTGGHGYSGYDNTNLVYDAVSNTYVTNATALYVVFFDASGGILQSNTYDLIANGLNSAGTPQPTTQFTTPVYTAPVGTAIVRAGLLMAYQWNTLDPNNPSLFADDFDLEATPPPGAPVVTNQPSFANVALGGTAIFNVGVSNTAGVTYLWEFNNALLSDSPGHISGSATATLTVTGVTTNDIGHYRATLINGFGTSFSQAAPLAITGIDLFPTVSVTGTIGDTYEVDRSLTPSGPWTAVATVRLTTQPQYIVDYTLPIAPSAFYREVFQH